MTKLRPYVAAVQNERINFHRELIICRKQARKISTSSCARKMHFICSCHFSRVTGNRTQNPNLLFTDLFTIREFFQNFKTRTFWFKLIWFRIFFIGFLDFYLFFKNLLFRIQHFVPWRRANRYYALELQLRMSQVTYYNSTRHTTEKNVHACESVNTPPPSSLYVVAIATSARRNPH